MKTLKISQSRQDILKTNADATAMRLFVLLALCLLCCSGMFGQQSKFQETEKVFITEIAADNAANNVHEDNANRKLELVQWFMGSKQVSPVGQPTQTSPKAATPKKLLINCGMTPNRILSRTLLKKAMEFENNIA